MPNKTTKLLLTLPLLLFALSACSTAPTQAIPTVAPTQTIEPVLTQTPADLPLIESAVPRVTVEEAQAALASGEAIMVDVRSIAAYEASHIPGAVHLQLGEIETNPTGLNLVKDRWIITYCT
jgi:3-mercaptopyruvate sulfurtransferase SseA